ncbi:hypothetical protein [Mycolicibacterium sp. P9-22]|uniref:hypothetical protein n=1 Tax=Mycolicibacterium sp. P9-22 TaxID=2024613 RepID=UPI0011EFCD16|nr:hypothetical protein [Mycolicibacterium sp. P9-22]
MAGVTQTLTYASGEFSAHSIPDPTSGRTEFSFATREPETISDLCVKSWISFSSSASLVAFCRPTVQHNRAQPVATLAAPIFDRHRHVAPIIGVSPLRAMTPEQINSLGHQEIDAVKAVSEESSQ